MASNRPIRARNEGFGGIIEGKEWYFEGNAVSDSVD